MELFKKESYKNLLSVKTQAESFFLDIIPINPKYGIDGKTFRAFRNFNSPPSETYRNWIIDNRIIESYLKKLDSLNSYHKFKQIHSELIHNLNRYWSSVQGRKLSISQKCKIIDLFIKFLARTKVHNCKNLNNNLCKYGHVPLDKFSLLAIRENFYGIIISKNPSMGDIEDMATYYFLQDQIRTLTEKIKIPNLYFDYYAWNKFH